MFHFLHTFHPDPVLFAFHGITVYWYGFFIVTGIVLALVTAVKLASYYGINKDTIIDLSFWMILAGIAGARLYHIFLEIPYYLQYPEQIIKLWQGGLAIHGALIAGLAVLYIFSRKKGLNFWLLASILAPAAAIAQTVGRWGNYFNQELFGKPTSLPWGIPIDVMHRPAEFISFSHFHPAFLYESLGNLFIFFILLGIHVYLFKKKRIRTYYYFSLTLLYLILYSLLRFGTEFIRIDDTPVWFGIRFPQLLSGIIVITGIILLIVPNIKKAGK